MPFDSNKNRVRELEKNVDLSFYNARKIISKYGYTQKMLAERLNLSQATVSSIINGNPNIAQLKLMADAIGCDFLEFFNSEAVSVPAYHAPVVFSAAGSIKCPVCDTCLELSLSCPEKNL